MIRVPWLDHPLTEKQVRDHFMLMLEDDTEDKPWMVMGVLVVLVCLILRPQLAELRPGARYSVVRRKHAPNLVLLAGRLGETARARCLRRIRPGPSSYEL